MVTTLQTQQFNEDFLSLEKTERERAKNLIEEMKLNPMRNSEIMKGDYKGLRKRRKGRIRLLYAYCKDCRNRNDHIRRQCEGCDTRDNETLMFFRVGLRGVLY